MKPKTKSFLNDTAALSTRRSTLRGVFAVCFMFVFPVHVCVCARACVHGSDVWGDLGATMKQAYRDGVGLFQSVLVCYRMCWSVLNGD